MSSVSTLTFKFCLDFLFAGPLMTVVLDRPRFVATVSSLAGLGSLEMLSVVEAVTWAMRAEVRLREFASFGGMLQGTEGLNA